MGDLAHEFQPCPFRANPSLAHSTSPAKKRLFSHKPMVAGLVRLLGDDWVDDLDLGRMECPPTEYISDDLRTRRADLPWWVPFKPGKGGPAGEGG